MNKIFLLTIFMSLACVGTVFASYNDGVYVSGGYKPQSSSNAYQSEKARDRKELIKDYVEQMVIGIYRREVGEAIQRVIQRAKLQILPQIAFQAIQQTALQSFKQDQIKDIIKDAFKESYDYAIEQFDNGVAQHTIQSEVEDMITKSIEPIIDHPIFKHVAEKMLENGMLLSRQVLTQQMIQQYIRQATTQRKTLQEQYKKVVSSVLVQ